jgi:hypothetical protein
MEKIQGELFKVIIFKTSFKFRRIISSQVSSRCRPFALSEVVNGNLYVSNSLFLTYRFTPKQFSYDVDLKTPFFETLVFPNSYCNTLVFCMFYPYFWRYVPTFSATFRCQFIFRSDARVFHN